MSTFFNESLDELYRRLFLQSLADFEKENGYVLVPSPEDNKDAKVLAELIKEKGIKMKPVGDGVT